MIGKLKLYLYSFFDEFSKVINLIISNLIALTKRFWRQSWCKKIINVFISLIICVFVSKANMIIFTICMHSRMKELNIFQTVLFLILTSVIISFLYLNFAELFIFLSLGGIAIACDEFEESIKNRIKQYKIRECYE